MRRLKITSLLALIVGCIAFVGFGYTLLRAAFVPIQEEEAIVAPASSNVEPIEESVLPKRIVIPSISVDAAVQHTGITKRGTMAVPTNYTDAGWYRYGTVPGQAGSAVMSGHLDNGFGLNAVFRRLSEMKIGDDIYVKDAQGRTLRFEVVRISLYDPKASTDDIFAASTESHLNLITCEGQWDNETKTYSNRRVVFADFRGMQ